MTAAVFSLLTIVLLGGQSASILGSTDAHLCFESSRADNLFHAHDLKACNEAIRSGNMTPRNLAATLSNRGILRTRQGHYTAALQDHDEAISLMPDLAVAYINRGNTRYYMRDFQGALSDFDRAIELNARPAHVPHFNRALVFKKLGQKEDALRALELALELAPASESIRAMRDELKQTD